jgi:hypothetical protein
MTEGYWLKGSTCINIHSESHISAVIRNPSRYGIATDLARFALDQNEGADDSNDLLIGKVLSDGWTKIRRFVGHDVDHWTIVFAEYVRSRLDIVQFLKNALSEDTTARSDASLTLEGLEAGFHREYDSIQGGCGKYLEEEAGGFMKPKSANSGEMNVFGQSDSLHVIKGLFQKKYMGKQCELLRSILSQVIAATREVAPVREKLYLRKRSRSDREPRREEERLERCLYWHWNERTCQLPGCWRNLVGYQVNLPRQRQAEGWGEIDLLGTNQDHLPVIVELKAGGSSYSPAAMLTQAAAYGVAIQKAWPERLRAEWAKKVAGGTDLCVSLKKCTLVCAAPTEYWKKWVGDSPKARKVSIEAWKELSLLQKAFSDQGFPSIFVKLDRMEPSIQPLPEEYEAGVSGT